MVYVKCRSNFITISPPRSSASKRECEKSKENVAKGKKRRRKNLEGSEARNGRRCEGTAAKRRRGVGGDGGGAGDLTHVVKVEGRTKRVMVESSS